MLLDEDLTDLCDDILAGLPRSDQRRRGREYVRGLLVARGRKSIRNIAAISTEPAAEQALHHFVSDSTWDWMPVRRALGRHVTRNCGARTWVLHPTLIRKAGTHSVGVGRRYSPGLGSPSTRSTRLVSGRPRRASSRRSTGGCTSTRTGCRREAPPARGHPGDDRSPSRSAPAPSRRTWNSGAPAGEKLVVVDARRWTSRRWSAGCGPPERRCWSGCPRPAAGPGRGHRRAGRRPGGDRTAPAQAGLRTHRAPAGAGRHVAVRLPAPGVRSPAPGGTERAGARRTRPVVADQPRRHRPRRPGPPGGAGPPGHRRPGGHR